MAKVATWLHKEETRYTFTLAAGGLFGKPHKTLHIISEDFYNSRLLKRLYESKITDTDAPQAPTAPLRPPTTLAYVESPA